jgi:type II secretion system protein C
MARARKTGKKVMALSPESRERILAAALEHPGLGVRRLARVLKGEGIEASESALHSALRKHELHTREHRLRLLEDRHLSAGIELAEGQKQALEKFNPRLRERQMECLRPGALLVLDVVDLGDFQKIGSIFLHAAIDPSSCLAFAQIREAADPLGAESLLKEQAIPFFREHGIELKAVLNGPGMVFAADGEAEYPKFLETQSIAAWPQPGVTAPQKNGFFESFERSVRAEYLAGALPSDDIQGIEDLQNDFAAWLARYNSETQLPGFPNMGRSPLAAFQSLKPPEVSVEKLDPGPASVEALPPAVALPAAPSPLRVEKADEWAPGRANWIFRAVNVALVCLVIYFGWMMASKLLDIRGPETDSGRVASAQPEADALIDPAPAAVPPLDHYHVVWERNLFGVSKAALDASGREKITATAIAVAGKDVGLKLIGTVVASNPVQNYAVIDVTTTREQGIFRENERAGKAVIRRILRNSVIIETDGGQRRRLTVEDGPAKAAQTPAAPVPDIRGSPAPPPKLPGIQESQIDYKVPLEAVASLSATRRLIQQTRMSQHLDKGEPDGLRLGAVAPGSPLARMGLKTGDVVKALNDEEITGLEKAEEFLQALSEGGDFTILVERSSQLRNLNVNIK